MDKRAHSRSLILTAAGRVTAGLMGALLLLALIACRSAAELTVTAQQASYGDQLATFMQAQMASYQIPGAAVAVVRDGEIEHLAGFGVANAAGDPVTPDTPFLLASLSKSFTATGLMQLVEAGQISLDDPVLRYLPWFEVAGGRGGDITIAQLLYQSSGFSEKDGVQATLRPAGSDALEAGVRDLAEAYLSFEPGADYEYSNLNYNTLGLLIQVVSGQPYETYIETQLFEPLEMAHSYSSRSSAREGGAASGYYPFFGFPLRYDNYMPYSQATLPAAGLWSSARDMSHYLIAHLNGGRFGDASILSAAGIRQMQEVGFEWEPGSGYAMGWHRNQGFLDREFLETLGTSLSNESEIPIVYHTGDWANYKSMALLLPEQAFGVVILMNSNDPTVASALQGFAWDVTLIAHGGQAQYFPPWQESFAVRYSRWLFSAAVLLLILELIWSAGAWRRLRRGAYRPEAAGRLMVWHAALPLFIDVALVAYMFLKLLPDNATTLPILLRHAPDLGLLATAMLLLAAGWGAVRTLLMLMAWRRRPGLAAAQLEVPDEPEPV